MLPGPHNKSQKSNILSIVVLMGFLDNCEVFFAGVFLQTHTYPNMTITSLTGQKEEKC